MKHLKYKKVFESILPELTTIEDIKDICLELEDVGLRSYIGVNRKSLSKARLTPRYEIEIVNTGSYFYYKDVKEVVERLRHYLGDRLRKIEVYGNNWAWEDISSKDYLGSIYSLKIEFVV